MMNTRLYRSRSDVMIAGICSGIGRYLGIDSTFVRLFFVLLSLANGLGVLVYFLLWIVLPLEGQRGDGTLGQNVQSGSEEIAERARLMGEDLRNMVNQPNPRAAAFVGGALILLGLVFLLDNLPLPWLQWLDFDVLWPLLLILAGAALVARYLRRE